MLHVVRLLRKDKGKIDYTFSGNFVFSMFSFIERKFITEFLSSDFLSTGISQTTFAFLGNKPSFILLFIDCKRNPAK